MTGYLGIKKTNADTPIQQHDQSHLFTLRLWCEEETGAHSEWRGKIQHVMSGEAHYFREWQALVDLLLEMVATEGIEARTPGAMIEEITP